MELNGAAGHKATVLEPVTLLDKYELHHWSISNERWFLFRSSHQRCFVKITVLKHFAIFTGKHLRTPLKNICKWLLLPFRRSFFSLLDSNHCVRKAQKFCLVSWRGNFVKLPHFMQCVLYDNCEQLFVNSCSCFCEQLFLLLAYLQLFASGVILFI